MITNDIAVKLGQIFQPILLFDPTERFFPVVAEEMLDHRATEPWSDSNTHERGSAVLVAEKSATTFGDANVQAGSHTPAGGHIDLSPTPPNGIGQSFGADPTHQDLFLDIAGWQNAVTSDPATPRFTNGSIDYLDLLFRGLSSLLNPSLPLDQPTRPPEFTIPRSTSPTVYFECQWAGMYPRFDFLRGGSRDFPPAIGPNPASAGGILNDLDSYVALTYYMLYPAMEPSPLVRNDDGAVRKREGQWEAITIFLRGRPGDRHGYEGVPDFPVQITENDVVEGLEPRFVAYSRGYEFGADVDSPLAAEVRLLSNVIVFKQHPLAYVTAGTHKNLFEIGAIVNTGDSPPDPTLNSLGGAMMGVAGTAAGICLALFLVPEPLISKVAFIVCVAVSAVLFLIGLLLFILSFFLKGDPPVTEAPNPGSTDLARDGGPGALPSGQAPPHRPGVQPVGAALTATLRIINRFPDDPVPPVTTYPLPAPLTVELPTWWDFPGRWGVRIINRATNDWDSGTRRTDGFGRSRAYWNTYRLVSFLNDPARTADGITA
jgi:hypothetical protein